MTPLQSSNLEAVGYDAVLGMLTIDFTNGTRYRYANVPPDLYTGLLAASSPGRYFLTTIRPNYAGTKVERTEDHGGHLHSEG